MLVHSLVWNFVHWQKKKKRKKNHTYTQTHAYTKMHTQSHAQKHIHTHKHTHKHTYQYTHTHWQTAMKIYPLHDFVEELKRSKFFSFRPPSVRYKMKQNETKITMCINKFWCLKKNLMAYMVWYCKICVTAWETLGPPNFICLSVCLCVWPAFTAYILIIIGWILMKLSGSVGT